MNWDQSLYGRTDDGEEGREVELPAGVLLEESESEGARHSVVQYMRSGTGAHATRPTSVSVRSLIGPRFSARLFGFLHASAPNSLIPTNGAYS